MRVQLVRENTCCFTGHRQIPDLDALWLRRRIRETVLGLVDQGVNVYLSGGAMGFDLMAAQEVLRLRDDADIKLVMVLPGLGQEERWSPYQQARYRQVLWLADEIIYTGDIREQGCFHRRNRYMVDHSAWCVAYLQGSRRRGGTLYTVRYALGQGVKITNLASQPHPDDEPYTPDSFADLEPGPDWGI